MLTRNRQPQEQGLPLAILRHQADTRGDRLTRRAPAHRQAVEEHLPGLHPVHPEDRPRRLAPARPDETRDPEDLAGGTGRS